MFKKTGKITTMLRFLHLLALVQLVPSTSASLQDPPPPPPPLNLRPIIGIVSQPLHSDPGLSYIAASYVKFVEMAGGRAVPLKFGDATSEIDGLLDGLNGVLWPGGGADVGNTSSPYYQFAAHIWNRVIEKNDKGVKFPMWGTCLGFEFIHIMASGNTSMLECDYDAEDLPLRLDFVPKARTTGELLARMSDGLYNALNSLPLTQNEHRCGVSPSSYEGASGSKLSEFFDIKATNLDRNKKEFVSLVEGKKYPVWGMQAHPEKSNFEWVTSEKIPIPHTLESIEMSQYFSNFFMNECRGNMQKLENETSKLMYNYSPTYTGATGGYFQQTYTFPIIQLESR